MFPTPPIPNQQGWFEPAIGQVPPDWPWALPNLYAINIAADPTIGIVGASASPSGEYKIRQDYMPERMRYEVIGFWEGVFRVVNLEYLPNHNVAAAAAQRDFDMLPVRFLLHAGKVNSVNQEIQITGKWPQQWKFLGYQDIGVFCAYLYELSKPHHLASEFREMIKPAWPVTEQLIVFNHALSFAIIHLSPILQPNIRVLLQEAHSVVQVWLNQ